MSYTPTNWKAGDVVTSAKLNKIEQGIASSGGVVIPTYTLAGGGKVSTTTCDMTYEEICSAIENHECVCCILDSGVDGGMFLQILEQTTDTICFSAMEYDPSFGNAIQVALVTHSSNSIHADFKLIPLATATPGANDTIL